MGQGGRAAMSSNKIQTTRGVPKRRRIEKAEKILNKRTGDRGRCVRSGIKKE